MCMHLHSIMWYIQHIWGNISYIYHTVKTYTYYMNLYSHICFYPPHIHTLIHSFLYTHCRERLIAPPLFTPICRSVLHHRPKQVGPGARKRRQDLFKGHWQYTYSTTYIEVGWGTMYSTLHVYYIGSVCGVHMCIVYSIVYAGILVV